MYNYHQHLGPHELNIIFPLKGRSFTNILYYEKAATAVFYNQHQIYTMITQWTSNSCMGSNFSCKERATHLPAHFNPCVETGGDGKLALRKMDSQHWRKSSNMTGCTSYGLSVHAVAKANTGYDLAINCFVTFRTCP